jgi:IPT/TIG domain
VDDFFQSGRKPRVVVSSSEITTTVPADATTGKVEVKTPSSTLFSNVAFRVTPTISSFDPTKGPVDTSVVITGEGLTGATSVTFGGVKATSFKVDSYTRITATVPTGAKTGMIGVTTPGGTTTSTSTFTID